MGISFLGQVGAGSGGVITLTSDVPQSTAEVAYFLVVVGGGTFLDTTPFRWVVSDDAVVTRSIDTLCYDDKNTWDGLGGSSVSPTADITGQTFTAVVQQPIPAGNHVFVQGFTAGGGAQSLAGMQWRAFLFAGVDANLTYAGFQEGLGNAGPTTDCEGGEIPAAPVSGLPFPPTVGLTLAMALAAGDRVGTYDAPAPLTPCWDPGIPHWAFINLCDFSGTYSLEVLGGGTCVDATWRIVFGFLLSHTASIHTQFACPGHNFHGDGSPSYLFDVAGPIMFAKGINMSDVGIPCTPVDVSLERRFRASE